MEVLDENARKLFDLYAIESHGSVVKVDNTCRIRVFGAEVGYCF